MTYRTLISISQLADHCSSPDWVLFDCRFSLADPDAGSRLYRQGHIPGAHYAHLDRDLASPVTPDSGRHPLPDPEDLARKLGEWGVGDQTQVVVYDDAGSAMAARMWWLLRWLGHESVACLDGGIGAWTRAGFELSVAPPSPQPRDFRGTPVSALWLDAVALQRGLADGQLLLVDARAPERFRGEVEPIDPVAGHVPGAVNRPFQSNLAADGRFRPAAELKAQFDGLLEGRLSQNLVHMCGSGVTACQNLLAMEYAGLAGSRLYSGSWSEWIRDPARPVATGPAATTT